MPENKKSNEIHITRIYNAPLKMVWEAWTNTDQVAQWWGPRGFTITTHSKDLKTGGNWNYTMHGPDGVDYPNTTKYLEVEKYARLIYDHGGNSDQPPLFRVNVQFIDLKDKTRMEMSMALPTPEAAEETKKFIKKANGNTTWDRLAEYLEKQSSGKDQFVINRSFDAPLEVMFKMWTDTQHLAKWIPPAGFKMNYMKSEIKPGGSAFSAMTDDKGNKMYGKASYLEITKPNRIVYTQQFCDEKEQVTRHPLSKTWPETMKTTVLFSEEGSEKTRVTLTWEPFGKTTAEELATFVQAKSGMTQGWTGSFDQLENYLQS